MKGKSFSSLGSKGVLKILDRLALLITYSPPTSHILNEESLRARASEIKCACIAFKAYGKKQYIRHKNMADTRDEFRARFGLTEFAGNYMQEICKIRLALPLPGIQ